MILQELALPNDLLERDRDLPILATLFDDKYINDWNTTDWLCVKVLGPWIQQDVATHNSSYETAKQIASWVDDPRASLWRQRASLVSFVNITCDGDDDDKKKTKKKKKKKKKSDMNSTEDQQNSTLLLDLQFDIASKLLASSNSKERFIQTGIGWVLRERSKSYPNRVVEFTKQNSDNLSKEAFNMMTCKLSNAHRSELGLNTSTAKKRKRR